MSDDKFKLCAKAGLRVYLEPYGHNRELVYQIKAEDVEKMLSEAAVVWGEYKGAVCEKTGMWGAKSFEDTHTARLLLIEEIKPKSRGERAMDLLKEFARQWENEWIAKTDRKLYEEAKQLLSEGE